VDNDQGKVAALESGDVLIHEKHLPELLKRYHNNGIRFTTDLHEAAGGSQAIFIAVGRRNRRLATRIFPMLRRLPARLRAP